MHLPLRTLEVDKKWQTAQSIHVVLRELKATISFVPTEYPTACEEAQQEVYKR